MKDIIHLFSKPRIIAIVGDVHSGKSNLIYYLINELNKDHSFSLYTYGLRATLPNATAIYSTTELEKVRNSIIFLDELSSLLDLDDRKSKRNIENTFRLLHHNNNVIVLCGPPENFKKFISAKVQIIFYKQCTLQDFINGSSIKHHLTNYKGSLRGSEMLSLEPNETLLYDGLNYQLVTIPYLEQHDSKKQNVPLLVPKNVRENVHKKVHKKNK